MMTSSRPLLLLAACALSLGLSGCAVFAKPDDTVRCPDTGLIQDAATMTVFAEDSAQTLENVVMQGKLDNYGGGCTYKDGMVEFVLELDVAAAQGPKGRTLKSGQFPYFVAVLGPDEEVLQRQSFSTTVPFDNVPPAAPVDASRTMAVRPGKSGVMIEQHHLRLPAENKADLHTHKVVIGFELTPAQLAFNRDQPVKKK